MTKNLHTTNYVILAIRISIQKMEIETRDFYHLFCTRWNPDAETNSLWAVFLSSACVCWYQPIDILARLHPKPNYVVPNSNRALYNKYWLHNLRPVPCHKVLSDGCDALRVSAATDHILGVLCAKLLPVMAEKVQPQVITKKSTFTLKEQHTRCSWDTV